MIHFHAPAFAISRRAALAGVGAAMLTLATAPQALAQQFSVLRPRIEAALNSVRTQRGSFVQIDTTTGYGLQGDFRMSRPGRLRFEYATRPQLLIADGSTVAQINTQSCNVTRTRLNATPLRVILAENVDLTDGVTVTKMEQTPDSLFVTLYETRKRNQGLLTVFLDVNSFDLRGWKIEENDGEVTTVILSEVERDVYINPTNYEIPRNGQGC